MKTYHEGEVILHSKSSCDALLHIQKGNVKAVSKRGAILYEYTEGEILGVQTFLDTGNIGEPYDVRACTYCEVLSISSQSIEHLAANNPLAGARVYRNLTMHCAIRLQMDLLSMRAWQR